MTTVTDTATQAPFAEPNPYATPAAETRGFSISSLVLGLVSIIASYTFIVPAIGLVLGVMALKREPAARTMAIWGIVLNSVMLAGAVLATLGFLVFGLAMLPFAFI
ncbi:DUF4190 domain-containing protein [Agromyces subbeticus]|uniref:DUF4190 domain-containing protein n=1 Tax=Agromyces subbeticus TaxID=293890 RepID=UPI0003B34009|nr:DUF4190 domain-containing protein [Agromyces subbeticus]